MTAIKGATEKIAMCKKEYIFENNSPLAKPAQILLSINFEVKSLTLLSKTNRAKKSWLNYILAFFASYFSFYDYCYEDPPSLRGLIDDDLVIGLLQDPFLFVIFFISFSFLIRFLCFNTYWIYP